MTPCTICGMPATQDFAKDLPVCGSIQCEDELIAEVNYLADLEKETHVPSIQLP